MSELAPIIVIAGKDLRQELRSRAVTVATLFFAAITLLVLAFAVSGNGSLLADIAPGALWTALAFAGVISAAQSYAAEGEENSFEQLLLYPVPRATLYLGKLLANWLYLAVLAVLMLPVTAVLFGLPVAGSWPLLLLTLLLGTLGFALIATFYAALTANLRARESLLPVLMFPVVVPILLASVRATSALTQLGNRELAADWLQLLVGFDLVYLVTCTAIFRFTVEE
ncbi:MAG TPA: heme exporter protein CcmB [Trueperaceae bacterium]